MVNSDFDWIFVCVWLLISVFKIWQMDYSAEKQSDVKRDTSGVQN